MQAFCLAEKVRSRRGVCDLCIEKTQPKYISIKCSKTSKTMLNSPEVGFCFSSFPRVWTIKHAWLPQADGRALR